MQGAHSTNDLYQNSDQKSGQAMASLAQSCHNLLMINPRKHTPNPEIFMENTAPYGSRRLKNPNIQKKKKLKILIFGSTASLTGSYGPVNATHKFIH